MKICTDEAFQIVYSIFQHEYLGYLFSANIVQLNQKGEPTLKYQNVSSQNAVEFESGLDENDYKLIQLIETIQQEAIIKKFSPKKVSVDDFFLKVFKKEKNDKADQKEYIENYIELRRQKIIQLLQEKHLYITARDGHPTSKRIHIAEEPATVLFHFRRNEEDTHYFPTIKYKGEKLDFFNQGSFILCQKPAWIVIGDTLYTFKKEMDANKLKPFLQKKFISIKRDMEATYYEKFVVPLVASFDVYAKGFDIFTEQHKPTPVLSFAEYDHSTVSLFNHDTPPKPEAKEENGKILFELHFQYGKTLTKAGEPSAVKVRLEKNEDSYTFIRVRRQNNTESEIIKFLADKGLEFKGHKVLVTKEFAFQWLSTYSEQLQTRQFNLKDNTSHERKYFIGKSQIELKIKEDKDWFDIQAIVIFGEFEIPFLQIRKLILQGKRSFVLPNGEIAYIPEAWFEQYADLLSFSESNAERNTVHLQKCHIAIVQEYCEHANLTLPNLSASILPLQDLKQLQDYPIPEGFVGTLRPYQKDGYNWLRFLEEQHLGACLADDMGLGKTIQTLAFLQHLKDKNNDPKPSLLVIPTSLIYNWMLEAKKFAPHLKVHNHTGTNRQKNSQLFQHFDLIITSYGVLRVDIDFIEKFQFRYVILDESQAIKNPSSNISQAVRHLNNENRLILTGTPLENTTLDLWSQMSFINPGILGSQAFFKKEFLNPIEKNNNLEKSKKLSQIIKPFILRRHKAQVAKDLPLKIENVQYCTMTDEQSEMYDRIKSKYRNRILEQIEQQGIAKTQLLLIEGLTQLRQIANHPALIEPEYTGTSGKMEDVLYKLDNIVSKKNKVLIFSQYVKHLTLFKNIFDARQWKYAWLSGSTRNRQVQVDQFQNDPETQIFLISLKAGGTGLNLTAAEYVFLLDPWWNPAAEAQAIDRAHRIGQMNTVMIYKFITQGTVEEKILALQREKQRLVNEVLFNEEQSAIKHLSREQVIDLLA